MAWIFATSARCLPGRAAWALPLAVFALALALLAAWMGWVGRRWGALRFGLACGVAFGLLLAVQFLVLRPIMDLPRLSPTIQAQVLLVTLVASLAGGVIGAFQGDWLAHFSR